MSDGAHASATLQGYNDYGQLGDGTTTTRNTPVAVLEPGPWAAIAARDRFSCGRKSGSNEIWCWCAGTASEGLRCWKGSWPRVLTVRQHDPIPRRGLLFNDPGTSVPYLLWSYGNAKPTGTLLAVGYDHICIANSPAPSM